MKRKLSIDDFKTKLTRNEMRSVEGGFLGIFCITGMLDGIKENTKFNWGRCR
ncbi:hypothetical protein OOZ15_18500 [Galbibacter sp. EGI 63066]|uniref:hypothetical protein n=1 Tax=Galbibacter sp. EGI 63066 TaxID=2993559 RepID=UPI0022499BD9|nr:hypothetical protein [Galbibacter sp. EGI 63066]MCX2681948.1 hypothetical protein [Galbibacter sp. EGI 63066]